MNKKILLLTDSLALPRQIPEFCSYNDTWPELLRKLGYSIHQVSIGGATSSDLLNQVSYHKVYDPDLVIIQVGIVDCVPRFATKLEVILLRKMGYVGAFVLKVLNHKRIRKIRKITYVDPALFERNVVTIQNKFNGTKIYFLGILPATEAYERILPGVRKRIIEYNKILKEKTDYISVEDFESSGIMSDFHHLNQRGHKQLIDKIVNHINV